MEPQVTAVTPPLQLQIADDLRIKIERGELAPGDSLPTLRELCETWQCSMNSARGAIALLRKQGLITSGRGRAPAVRTQPHRVIRSSTRHQVEKDLVLATESVRRETGLAEIDMGTTIDDLTFRCNYDVIPAGQELAAAFDVDPSEQILRRTYELADARSGARRSWSVSYLVHSVAAANPALLDQDREPWPGGTQHQLSTVGVEVARVVDEVTARMPTTVDVQQWDLDEGVPILRVRRISVDTNGRVAEVTDADFPADRTELSFTTELKPWAPGAPRS